jgi:minichromosome maintenance protein 10
MLAGQEKERETARRLGEGGSGTGAEYLRIRHGENQRPYTGGAAVPEEKVAMPDAVSLGLLGNSARGARLSPLKRKASGRTDSRRKKTRFLTAKGIKEAGREGLGAEASTADDDELVIV